MATHASALKRARQSEKRRQRNATIKSALRTLSKKVLAATEAKNSEEAKRALASTIPAVQKASAKRVIHKKNAARRISRLTKKLNALALS